MHWSNNSLRTQPFCSKRESRQNHPSPKKKWIDSIDPNSNTRYRTSLPAFLKPDFISPMQTGDGNENVSSKLKPETESWTWSYMKHEKYKWNLPRLTILSNNFLVPIKLRTRGLLFSSKFSYSVLTVCMQKKSWN